MTKYRLLYEEIIEAEDLFDALDKKTVDTIECIAVLDCETIEIDVNVRR